jgi:Uma2 family endonuclease
LLSSALILVIELTVTLVPLTLFYLQAAVMSATLSSAVSPKTRFTVADLLALPNEKDFELVNGQLVEHRMGFESSHIALNLCVLLYLYNQPRGLGWIQGSDCGYTLLLAEGPTVRKPDVSFVSFQRLPAAGGFPKGYPAVAPDLAVEVLSPNDLAYEVEAKIQDYLQAGVRLIWIINPAVRSAQVLRQDGSFARLIEADSLDGEDVLPGFTCRISSLFEIPQPA